MNKTARKLNRVSCYDYSQEGSYFVTLCTQNRAHLFQMEGFVGNGLCAVPHGIPNQIIHKWIAETQHKFPNIRMDKYVVMPDHLHMIITIERQCSGIALPDIMRFFKTMTTNEYMREIKAGFLPPFSKRLWQKSYYDHIIRNQQDYQEIWEYIENNPAKWMLIHGVQQ